MKYDYSAIREELIYKVEELREKAKELQKKLSSLASYHEAHALDEQLSDKEYIEQIETLYCKITWCLGALNRVWGEVGMIFPDEKAEDDSEENGLVEVRGNHSVTVIKMPFPLRRLSKLSNYTSYHYRLALRKALEKFAKALLKCKEYNVCFCYVYGEHKNVEYLPDNDNYDKEQTVH